MAPHQEKTEIMNKYQIEYDNWPLATVEIDESKAAEPIKQMVEFWSEWEEKLAEYNGDYTRAWLGMLARHILRNAGPPEKDEEGWYPLDGTHGIKLVKWVAAEHDDDLISIEQR